MEQFLVFFLAASGSTSHDKYDMLRKCFFRQTFFVLELVTREQKTLVSC